VRLFATDEARAEIDPPPPQQPGLIAAAEAELDRAERAEREALAALQDAFDAERTLAREQREAASRRDSSTTSEGALQGVREFEALDRRLAEARAIRQALERAAELPRAAARRAREQLASLRAEAARSDQLERRQLQVVDGRRRELAERERAAELARAAVTEAVAVLQAIRARRAELLGAEG